MPNIFQLSLNTRRNATVRESSQQPPVQSWTGGMLILIFQPRNMCKLPQIDFKSTCLEDPVCLDSPENQRNQKNWERSQIYPRLVVKTAGTFLSQASISGYSGIPGMSNAVKIGELSSLPFQDLSLSCVLKIKVDSEPATFPLQTQPFCKLTHVS